MRAQLAFIAVSGLTWDPDPHLCPWAQEPHSSSRPAGLASCRLISRGWISDPSCSHVPSPVSCCPWWISPGEAPAPVCPIAVPRAAKGPTACHGSAPHAQGLEDEGRALPVPRSTLPVLGSHPSHHAPWQVFLVRPSVNRKHHVLLFLWCCLLRHSCLLSSCL